jgi:glycogen operon protein
VRLAGDLIGDVDDHGDPIVGETVLILLNAHHEPIKFKLPIARSEHHWERVFDTSDLGGQMNALAGGEDYDLKGRSLVMLITRTIQETGQQISEVQAKTLRKPRRKKPSPESVVAQAVVPQG